MSSDDPNPLPRPAISAHRGGSEQASAATWDAYTDALASGAEYVEFDIRRTGDGTLVVYHDARVGQVGPPLAALSYTELTVHAGYRVPVVSEVMSLIAGRIKGHLDLKEPGYEDEVIRLAVDTLGEDGFVATTLEDRSVAEISRAFPKVRTALSLGRGGAGLAKLRMLAVRGSELFPMRRIRACGASGVAVHQRLARATVLRHCARHGLFTLVWTVNDEPQMARFLNDARVHVLTTDRPRRALALRDGTAAPRNGGSRP